MKLTFLLGLGETGESLALALEVSLLSVKEARVALGVPQNALMQKNSSRAFTEEEGVTRAQKEREA